MAMNAFVQLASDNAPVVQIGLAESLLGIALMLIGAGIAWGTLKTSVKNIDNDLGELKNDFKKLNTDFIAVKTIVEREAASAYAQPGSPIHLTKQGKELLVSSGIKKVIDENKQLLIEKAKSKKPTNAYDAEVCAIQIVKKHLEENQALMDEVKNNTFTEGATIGTVLFVGGIYFRDIVLPELGFDVAEIDKHKPSKK